MDWLWRVLPRRSHNHREVCQHREGCRGSQSGPEGLHIGVDPAASLEDRVKAASVQCAWANSVSRTQKAAEMEAEMDTKEHVKPIVSEWLGVRMGLEKVVGHLEDRVAPAKEYIEKKLQDIEAGEYSAEAGRIRRQLQPSDTGRKGDSSFKW